VSVISVVVGHIKKTDGFFGLYRGLVPRLISTYVNGLVSAAVADVSCSDYDTALRNIDWHCCTHLCWLLSHSVCSDGELTKKLLVVKN